MIAAGEGGSIINMSSIGGHGGLPRRAAYTASAAAIVNLTQDACGQVGAAPDPGERDRAAPGS